MVRAPPQRRPHPGREDICAVRRPRGVVASWQDNIGSRVSSVGRGRVACEPRVSVAAGFALLMPLPLLVLACEPINVTLELLVSETAPRSGVRADLFEYPRQNRVARVAEGNRAHPFAELPGGQVSVPSLVEAPEEALVVVLCQALYEPLHHLGVCLFKPVLLPCKVLRVPLLRR